MKVRRFFTLYFIPLIPLDQLGEYIECQQCKNTYNEKVLSYDPEQEQREFHAAFEVAVSRVLIYMMLADGHIDDAEIDVVRHIHRQLTGGDIQADEVRSETVAVRQRGGSVQQYLETVVHGLNLRGREMVLRAACMVAVADGELRDEEMHALSTIALTLELSESHLKGILMDAVAPREAQS